MMVNSEVTCLYEEIAVLQNSTLQFDGQFLQYVIIINPLTANF